MFERFTDRARRVVVLSQGQARNLKHSYVGTEHLLLGLIDEGDGVAARALESLGIDLEQVRREVEDIVPPGTSEPEEHIPFTPRAQKVLELSLREALHLGHNYIGTEHMLLGLIRERDGVAAQVLAKTDAGLDRVRSQVIQLLSGYAEPTSGEEAHGARPVLQETHPRSSSPASWPLCPRCRSPLEETARYRVLDVAPHEEGDSTRAVPFAFCSTCGVWLGTIG